MSARRAPRPGAAGAERRAAVLGAAAFVASAAGCASAPETGPPLENPASVAEERIAATGAEGPWRVRFRWEYGDPGGTLRGDGVGRINPPDRFRLDFFTTGEGSMAAVFEGRELSTLGQIEDVRLPDPPFLYAMAGLFRPGADAPVAGYRSDGGRTLVYEVGDETRRYRFEGGRLQRMVARRDGRVVREITLGWKAGQGPWPAEAEYRDRVTPSRVRWVLEDAEPQEEPYPDDIYDLDAPPP